MYYVMDEYGTLVMPKKPSPRRTLTLLSQVIVNRLLLEIENEKSSCLSFNYNMCKKKV